MSRLLIEMLNTKNGKAKVDDALKYKKLTFVMMGIMVMLIVFIVIAGIVSNFV